MTWMLAGITRRAVASDGGGCGERRGWPLDRCLVCLFDQRFVILSARGSDVLPTGFTRGDVVGSDAGGSHGWIGRATTENTICPQRAER